MTQSALNPATCVRGALALERAPTDAPMALALDLNFPLACEKSKDG